VIDIGFIRQNQEAVSKNLRLKKVKFDLKNFLLLDEQRKHLKFNFEDKRATQNRSSKKIGQYKKQGKDTKEILLKIKDLSNELKEISTELAFVEKEFQKLALKLPNMLDKDVPIGNSEKDNVLIHSWGQKPQFDFKPKNHLELATQNNLLNLPVAAKISGSGFALFTGQGASLERALINLMLDYHSQKHGYTELNVPVLVNTKTMIGTGQLPKMKEDMYKIENDDLYLIPTAEVPITHYFADKILKYSALPQKFMAYSTCFRREAGSHGKQTKGLQRLHQFDKVELVQFVESKDSEKSLEHILCDAKKILELLGLHYRIVTLCSGDTSFASCKTYDIEVWSPGQNKFLEVSSVSNFRDFQARRANIRYKDKDGKIRFVHTLNGSGVALPRLFIAILENYQNSKGSIELPKILNSYLKGVF